MKKNKYLRFSLLKRCIAFTLVTSMSVLSLGEGGSWREGKNVQNERQQIVCMATEANSKQIKNIIYMIPDGGGFPSYDLTKAVKEEGGLTYKYSDQNFTGTEPTSNKMYLDDYLYGSVETKSASSDVTDSAAAGTALATGNKTNNSSVGITSKNKPVANILEVAQLEGKSTGVIATCYQYDATPSAFYGHSTNRENYDEIIKQLKNSGVNIIMGAGLNYTRYSSSNRTSDMEKEGYVVVDTEEQLKNAVAQVEVGGKICGAFHASAHHIPYDFAYGSNYDGIDDSSKKTPTLAEMTQYSINALEKDQDGFFLMVEGSKIDYAGHAGEGNNIVSEFVRFHPVINNFSDSNSLYEVIPLGNTVTL